MNSGIYEIRSPSGGRYIGSAVSTDRRQKTHFKEMRAGLHKNRILQSAWAKYGDQLEFRVLIRCRPADLLFYEQRFIDAIRPRYNICPTAGNTLGLKWTEDSRRKKSEQVRGTKQSAETRAKRAATMTGHAVSAETRQKLAEQRGWKHSEETKQKMRGRERSPDHSAKLGVVHVGNRYRSGKAHTEETKRKISEKLVGRKLPDETRQRMSEAWARRRLSTDAGVV